MTLMYDGQPPFAQGSPVLGIAPQGFQCFNERRFGQFVGKHPDGLGVEFCHGAVGVDDQRQGVVHAVQNCAGCFAARLAAQLHGKIGCGKVVPECF